MRVFWDADTIRFMIDASEHASYNRELAAYIAPRLPKDAHVCDAGCGLGYLALELAAHAAKVTAADICPQALDVLRQNCAQRGIENIAIRCGDIEAVPPETPYDAMVFCLFGEGGDGLRIAKAQCRGDVFLVLRNYRTHRFSPGAHRMEYKGYREACAELEELGVPFERAEMSLDLGQPFRSLEDARLFFKRYSRDGEEAVTDDFVLSRVKETGNPDFPYAMAHLRHVGVIHLKAADIPRQFAP